MLSRNTTIWLLSHVVFLAHVVLLAAGFITTAAWPTGGLEAPMGRLDDRAACLVLYQANKEMKNNRRRDQTEGL